MARPYFVSSFQRGHLYIEPLATHTPFATPWLPVIDCRLGTGCSRLKPSEADADLRSQQTLPTIPCSAGEAPGASIA
jgi:hypothetical protein